MTLDQTDVEAAKDILEPNETVVMTARQRRVGPGGSMTTPTSVIATDKRVIIINRATLGVRKDFETIPYTQIASVRLERGIISSSVFVRVMGFDQDKGLLESGKQEGEIDGLNGNDAKMLSDYINKRLLEVQEGGKVDEQQQQTQQPREQQQPKDDGNVYCSKCGARNDRESRFCTTCGNAL
jgi:hypothetical protein